MASTTSAFNNNETTYYQILNVSPDATSTEIRKSYLKLSLKYHPDKNPDNQEEAKEHFVKIGQAYDVLSDPIKKRQYDRELASGRLFSSSSFFGNNSSGTGANGANGGGATMATSDEQTYESYRKAFDERMASLSPDELNTIKNVASVVGSIIGSVYGSKFGQKIGGNSKLGRALGETAGSLMGSLAGSKAGLGFVDELHNSSVQRVMYEDMKRVQKNRR